MVSVRSHWHLAKPNDEVKWEEKKREKKSAKQKELAIKLIYATATNLLRQSSKQSMITVCWANAIYYISSQQQQQQQQEKKHAIYALNSTHSTPRPMHVIEIAVAPFHLKVNGKYTPQILLMQFTMHTKFLQLTRSHFHSLCNSQTMQENRAM